MNIATAEIVPFHTAHMSEASYDAERARLRELYGDSTIEASAKRDQALAVLFYRSGWTQEQLAKKEDKSRQWIVTRLRFGRFLNFATTVANSETLPKNLTERRFRGFWDQTEGGERDRFKEAHRLIQEATVLALNPAPKGYPKRIVDKFADSKWHSLPAIAKHLDVPEKEAESSLQKMATVGYGDAKTEIKKIGTVKHYKFYRQTRMISSQELLDKLTPIVEELKVEGKKNMATACPPAIALLATKLQKLLNAWSE